MNKIIRLAGTLVFAGYFSLTLFAQSADIEQNTSAYTNIHIPLSVPSKEFANPVVVAVIDDGFRLTHQELSKFIYHNPDEIPNNRLDDDGNDYYDDISGWDISDNDNDVSVPEYRKKEFYHGTYIASLITRVAKLHYGTKAGNRIKILPVKVLSDQAGRTYIKDGYKGIKYAIDNGADIICMAWSGGNPGTEELKIIQEAYQKGILMIASVGNFNEEKVLYPACMPEVIAVSGINNKFQKQEASSYGMEVDLSAPAELVKGAHPDKDNAYISIDGTSASTAFVTACAAILLSKSKDLSHIEIKEALLNSSTPFPKTFSIYGGKMGAGIVNLESAIDYISNTAETEKQFSPLRSKGSILINANTKNPVHKINPAGSYHGFYLETDNTSIKKPEKHSFSIIVGDSIWQEYQFSDVPAQIFVPANSLKISTDNSRFRKRDVFKISYHGKTIDSTTLYCSGTNYLSMEQGSIEDGSGSDNYSNHCSCKWIISLPVGKRIKFIFDKMDTQANVDFVYLFDGPTAIPENIIARFSGNNKPPVVYSLSNEVLVWFVTDKDTTGKGWKCVYKVME